MRKLSLILIALLLPLVQNRVPLEDQSDDKKLVVIMLDGCRWDYFSRNPQLHPGYSKIKTEGVVADYVQPILPSNSFPSWTTISTGKVTKKLDLQKYSNDLGSLFRFVSGRSSNCRQSYG